MLEPTPWIRAVRAYPTGSMNGSGTRHPAMSLKLQQLGTMLVFESRWDIALSCAGGMHVATYPFIQFITRVVTFHDLMLSSCISDVPNPQFLPEGDLQ